MSTNANKRTVQPYLSFEDRCEEAFYFYRKATGVVMHSNEQIGETTIAALDGRRGG